MRTATTLIVETPGKRVTLALPDPLDVWEVRDYCRTLGQGTTPQIVTLSGRVAWAAFEAPTPLGQGHDGFRAALEA